MPRSPLCAVTGRRLFFLRCEGSLEADFEGLNVTAAATLAASIPTPGRSRACVALEGNDGALAFDALCLLIPNFFLSLETRGCDFGEFLFSFASRKAFLFVRACDAAWWA